MRILFVSILALTSIVLLAGCAGAAATPAPPAANTESPILPQPTGTQAVGELPTPTLAPTSEPFVAQFTPAPTETPLPTLELPSPAPAGPTILGIWDGLPAYLADSRPNFDFRLRFDPAVWALTRNEFGFPALIHRSIPACSISPSSGHGLPPNLTVEHDVRRLGAIDYQLNVTFLNGVKQYATYSGGDGVVFTAFEVAFQDQADQCMQAAETVLATLTSIPVSQATPAATP